VTGGAYSASVQRAKKVPRLDTAYGPR
jgi:hypothetical protein